MMRFALLVALLSLAAVVGCAAPAEPAAPEAVEAQSFAPGESAPADNTAAVVPANSAAGQEWDELLRRLRQDYEVNEQQKGAQSEEHYKLAERHYQAGDFDRALLECQKAIQLNANNAAAHALLTEINFIRNRGAVTPESAHYDRIIKEAVVRHQQLVLEIDDKFNKGRQFYNAGQYDDAEREFRTILEYVKWMPTGVELETRRKQTVEWLERTKQARKQSKLDEEKARLATIETEKSREEVQRKLEQRRTLETLFGQAQLHFEREEYVDCIRICDRVLYIDPTIGSVQEMKMVASRLRHKKEERDLVESYVREWKRTFEQIELNGLTQATDLEWADREVWEQIRTRKPKGIQDDRDREMPEADRRIAEKLHSIKLDFDMSDQPLPGVIDFIQQYTQITFLIDTSENGVPNPEEKLITIKLTNIEIDGALTIILKQHDLAYRIENGVVIVTSEKASRAAAELELYDVRDIIYSPPDLPGVDISMASDPSQTGFNADESTSKSIDGAQLEELIKKTIDKDTWEEPNSATFQNGLLVVSAARDTHRRIQKFLNDLRASTGILVSVETRFLMVEDSWLEQVGMDIRDVNGPRAAGILALDDINPAFALNPQFVSPGGGLPSNSAGVGYTGGHAIQRRMGARVQNIMVNDFLLNRFFQQSLTPVGGMTLQYTLMDDISLEAILRLVSRSDRAHTLTAPKITLFNNQRGNVRISNQFAYIKDYDIQIATASVAPDPIPGVAHDGISLDVKPIVSADRKFITLDLRPTIATLHPQPPSVFGIEVNLSIPGGGAPITTGSVVIETPTLNVQRLRSSVVIPDRGTLLIGGLTVFFDIDAESSIPVFRHIPIVGNFGSNKFKGLQRKQFLVVLRAKIIIPSEEEKYLFE